MSWSPCAEFGIQSAHERRQPSRERGRNNVGECCPQFARKSQGEIHSVEWYQGQTAHLAACSSNRKLPSLTRPYVDNPAIRSWTFGTHR
jgi:hypothetical protein